MNRKVGRRYLPVVMMASSLAIASACSSTAAPVASSPTVGASSPGTPSVTPTASVAPTGPAPAVPVAPAAEAGALTVSNGSADVAVGSSTVHLASTATDVSWSADGSEIAYVDSDGNIAVASWDGSGVRVLTKTDKSVLRAQPEWLDGGRRVAFSVRDSKGVWNLNSVETITDRLDEDKAPFLDGPVLFDESHHDHSASTAFKAGASDTGGHNLMVWEHDATAGAQVWIVDYNQRDPESKLVIAGADPAISPDGTSIAYVGKNGQLYVTPIAKASKSSSKQITFGLTGIVHPVWTPDGTGVTFATATDIESVSAKLAPDVTTNKPTVLSAKPGVPSYVSSAATAVSRLTGADPIADSIAASKRQWNLTNAKVNRPSQGNLSMPDAVTLVSSADPTVLTHIAGLSQINGPILFTDGKTLDPRTAAEIKRALATATDPNQGLAIKIYGDTSVMSPAIQTAAAKLGYAVSRTTGAARRASIAAVVVLSDTDQAALGNLAHLYQNFTVVMLHGATMTPAQQALFRAPTGEALTVYAAGADAHTALAAAWETKPTSMDIVDLPVSSSPDESVTFQAYDLSSVSLVAEGDWESMALANLDTGTTIVVGKDGTLTAAAVTWLRTNSAAIGAVHVYGSTSNVSAATLATVVAAISGPAGSNS